MNRIYAGSIAEFTVYSDTDAAYAGSTSVVKIYDSTSVVKLYDDSTAAEKIHDDRCVSTDIR